VKERRRPRVRQLLRVLLDLQTTHPLATLALWVALAAFSAAFTAGHLGFETSQSSLVAQDNHLMQLLKMADRFSDLDAFVVAVENRNTRRSLEFARRLGSRLEGDHGHYAQVFYRVDPELLRPWALLYLSEKQLLSLRDNLREHGAFIRDLARSPGLAPFFELVNEEMASRMVGELFTGFLDEGDKGGTKGPMDLGFLTRTLRQMKGQMEGSAKFISPWRSVLNGDLAEEAEEGYFWTEGKKYLLIFVAPMMQGQGFSKGAQDLAALRQAIASAKKEFPDVSAGVTGQKALDEDEKEIALRDISLATSLSLIGVAVLLIVFWRGIRRPLLEMVVLVIALCVTFGLTTLFIGHLNLLSVTFAPMLLGLGIDYGAHWFARFSEERHRSPAPVRETLAATMDKVGPAILLAGLSASLSFFPLVLTGFKGLSELGFICGMGLAVATAGTLFLLPALIALFDRSSRMPLVRKPVAQEIRPLLRSTGRRTVFFAGLAVVASALAFWGAVKVRFDLNMLHLQSRTAESVVWENKLITGSKYASIYGVLFARSFQEIDEKTRAAERLPTVSKVNSIRNVLPSDQDRKVRLLREMKPLLGDVRSIPVPSGPVDVEGLDRILSRIRFKMVDATTSDWGAAKPLEKQMEEVGGLIDGIRRDFTSMERPMLLGRLKRFEGLMIGDLNDKLSLLYQNMETRPLEPGDLPKPLRDRFVGPDNLYLLRVFPAGNVWEPQFLANFVRDLRSEDPDVTGDPITLYVFTKAFRDACIKAALYGVAFIAAFLALTLRSPVSVLAVLMPLFLGTLWTFGLMHLFGLDLNLANSIFMPLVVGAGVEYGIIVVQRWRQSPDAKRFSLPASTGTGVILAGLTTTVGFGSLTISEHRGIHSLGVLTTIGSLAVLGAAVLFLPALLHAVGNLRAGGRNDVSDEWQADGSRAGGEERRRRRRVMKAQVFLPLILTGLLAVLGQTAARAGAPTEVVQKMLEEVMAIQSDPAPQSQPSRAARRAEIRKVILKNFNFDEMARQALGQQWGVLDGARRAEFKSVFQDLFLDSYSRLVLDFLKKERITYAGEAEAGDRVTVRTVIQRTNEEIPVDYVLPRGGGGLLVRDVSIDGVSIVANYQKSFSRVIKQESYESLLKKMKLQQQAAGGSSS